MDKRYQVFISSTYEDLKQERLEVIQALLELDCIPAGMELFPAADDDQWSLIKKVIDDCDYYIVIVGGRYGSISPKVGKSYTQMEYEYALSQEKPVIGFIHRNTGDIAASKTETSEEGKKKLEDFKKLVEQKMCKYWTTPAELGSVVSRSLVKLIKNNPAIGWVKSDLVPDETASQEILKLRNIIDELEIRLNELNNEASINNESLSNGDEKIILSYEAIIDFGNGYESYGGDTITGECSLTWNEIFFALAPRMFWEDSLQDSLKSALETVMNSNESGKIVKDNQREGVQTIITNFQVYERDFFTVLIQFWALGYIKKMERSHHWSLTPYGLKLLMENRAIKKGETKMVTDDIPF